MSKFRRRLLSKIANSQGEGFTVDTNGEWRVSSETPPSSDYVLYESFAHTGVDNSDDTIYIDINGYSTFTFYIQGYAEGGYDYVMVSQLDTDIDWETDPWDEMYVFAHTQDEYNTDGIFDDIRYYKQVTFTNIDCQKHRITIIFRKDGSAEDYNDRGYVLLPKRDTSAGTIPSYITDNYLTIVALEDGLKASLSDNACEYCIDGSGVWQTLSAGTATPSINAGQTLSFRAELTPNSSNGIGIFAISKGCNLEGNCMSMLFGDNATDNFSLSSKDYAFQNLFSNCITIVNVSPNFLPATTLVNMCYYEMFRNCTSLTTAPELPATTLAAYCYAGMFNGCTGLTIVPNILPATTLAYGCYGYMFSNCTSLETAPELPATTLADYCYEYMFQNCDGLTEAPTLPATTLADYCYEYMFQNCDGLTEAPTLPATTLATYCYYNMFRNCTSLTVAPELPATTLASNCYSYMFINCTGLTVAPELPATTLATYCYNGMFYGCTSLTTAPELPATTLANYCYFNMFYGCTSLTTAPELPATTLATYCYYNMFRNCTGLTVAPELPATTLATYCYSHMFAGCTSLTSTPTLPATTLADYCYEYMFNSCTSLTTAPDLPATTLAACCYSDMFSDCTSLTVAPELPATTLASNCYSYMFRNCTGLTVASELPATTLSDYCYYFMFRGCTGLTEAPGLPATTLTANCYYNMFYGCTSLTEAPELPATTLAYGCYYNMFYGCTSLTEAPELPATTLAAYCYNNMFRGCNKLTYINMLAGDISATNCLTNWITGVASTGEIVLNSAVASSISKPSGWKTQLLTLSDWSRVSTILNPDYTNYHGVYESQRYTGVDESASVMYIDINGYTNFELKIRSYGENNWDYIMVSQLDTDIDWETAYNNTSLVKAHTRGLSTGSNNLSDYTTVTFSGIGGGSHRITVLYRKDSSQSNYDDKGYVIIKKKQ